MQGGHYRWSVAQEVHCRCEEVGCTCGGVREGWGRRGGKSRGRWGRRREG